MKNRNTFLNTKTLTLAALLFSGSALAQDDNGSKELLAYLKELVNTTVTAVADLIYESTPNLAETMLINVSQQGSENKTQQETNTFSFCQVYTALPTFAKGEKLSTPKGLKSLDEGCHKLILQDFEGRDPKQEQPEALTRSLANFNFGYITKNQSQDFLTDPSPDEGKIEKDKNQAINALSFDSLVTPSLYPSNSEAKKNALAFVNFVGKLYKPFPVLNSEVQDIKDTDEFANYQTALRSFIAAQSVATSNLYSLISARTAQKDIVDLGLEDTKGEKIKSPLQYREYLANRRTADGKWFDSVNNASSSAVAKETLIVLAEIQRSLQRLEKTNEKMLATLSVIQLQNLNQEGRKELNELAGKIEALTTEDE